jgi:murein L,D-transpeptidase YafK
MLRVETVSQTAAFKIRQMLPGVKLALCALVIAAGLSFSPGDVAALSIELKDVAPDRVERQRAAAMGRLPLPGTPDVAKTVERLAEKGMKAGAPMLIRIFKAESELEIWMERDGRYELFSTYPICHWSGTLGPKQREGDKQTPEGFYTITSRQLHRVGRWPRALNLGFPNAYDQALKRDGSYILVHGGCSSVGCFAMTNTVINEVYSLASASLRAGQRHIPAHVFPFRMTQANLDKHKDSQWAGFWGNLREGYDSFERTRQPPRVSVCQNKYSFQDASGPVEAGAPSPLAVCGGTAAAIRALDKSAWLVPLQPLQSQRASLPIQTERPLVLSTLDSQQVRRANLLALTAAEPAIIRSPASVPTVSNDQMYELVPQLNPPSVSRSVIARSGGARMPSGRPIPCALSRASCRKFVALRSRNGAQIARNAARKAVRTASRLTLSR